jgi:hypothetical protein
MEEIMKNLKAILLFYIFSSAAAYANQDLNKSVGRLGVQNDNAFFSVKEGLSTPCKFGIIYSPINTDSGKASYSALLLAKSSKTVLNRIIYNFDTNTELCNLTLVELKEN